MNFRLLPIVAAIALVLSACQPADSDADKVADARADARKESSHE